MSSHRARNALPPLFGILCLLGFLISPAVGVAVCIVGGAAFGVLWSSLGGSERRRHGRRAARS